MNTASRRAVLSLAILSATASLAGTRAWASPTLTYDLRVHGTGAKAVDIDGSVPWVDLDLYAIPAGDNSTFTDEGYQSGSGNLLSSNGGLLGRLSTYTILAPFNANGAQPGRQVDLDGDGDLDIGFATNGGLSEHWFNARSASMVSANSTDGFLIASFRFSPSTMLGTTQVAFAPNARGASQLLRVDGAIRNASTTTVVSAAPVTITAVPSGGVVQYLSGTLNSHLTVDQTIRPAAGATVIVATGLDVSSAGVLDLRDLQGNYGTHEVRINDAISGNAGGLIRVGKFSVGTTNAGTFNMSAGTITATQVLIGAGASGEFNQTGGAVATSKVVVGSSSPGVFRLAGGALSADDVSVGGAAPGSLTIDAPLSTLLVKGDIHVGITYDSKGAQLPLANLAATINMVSGVLTYYNFTAAGSGTVVHAQDAVLSSLAPVKTSAGMIRVRDGANWVQDGGIINCGSVEVFNSSVSVPTAATYTINGGTIHTSDIRLSQGGAVTQNGGDIGGHYVDVYSTSNYSLHAGSLVADQRIGVKAGGVMSQDGGTASTLVLSLSGRYQLFGGTLAIARALNAYGVLDFANGHATLSLAPNGMYNFSNTAQILNSSNATVTAGAGSLISFPAGFDYLNAFRSFTTAGLIHVNGQPLDIPAGQSIGGTGTITGDVTNEGLLSPGNSPGAITIEGNFKQKANGSMLVELAGTASDDFDTLTVTGSASLDGQLQVALLSGYTPAYTDTFTFITANSITGTFANAPASIAVPGFGAFDLTYTAGTVSLSHFTAVPEPAALGLLSAAGLALAQGRRRRN